MNDDNGEYYDEGGNWFGWFGWAAILVPGLFFFGPLIVSGVNSMAYPGYETCKAEIARALRDPGSADYEWPPRGLSHRSDPSVRGYMIEVRSKNGFGGMVSDVFHCTIEERGSETRYRIDW